MRKNNKNKKVIRGAFVALLSFIVMASLSQQLRAEELAAVEMSSKKLESVVQKSQVPVIIEKHAIGLRFSPQFGFLESADGNQIIFNKFNSGFATEFTLSPNVSIEGVLRYAKYDVRIKIPAFNSSSAIIGASMSGQSSVPGLYSSQSMDYIGTMRQVAIGANLKYELFPHSIITPFFGGGVTYFDNEYHSGGSDGGFMRVGLPQSVYGASMLAGMKLRLSQAFALVARAEAGSLLNNKNGKIYWGKSGAGASMHPGNSFRSYDQYYTLMTGVSFGI